MLEHTRRRALPRGRRGGRADAPSGSCITTFDGKPVEREPARRRLGRRHGAEGRLQALPAEGDPRAAAGHHRHHARPHPAGGGRRPARRSTSRRPARPSIERCVLVACGTAWHACLVGKFLIEQLARHPVRGRLRQRVPLPRPDPRRPDAADRRVAVGRDGRHARRASRPARERGAPVLAICNVVDSSIARRARRRALHARRARRSASRAPRRSRPSSRRSTCSALYLGRRRGVDRRRARAPAADRRPGRAAARW